MLHSARRTARVSTWRTCSSAAVQGAAPTGASGLDCVVASASAGPALVSCARVTWPADTATEQVHRQAAQLAWGRCLAALQGRPVAFAAHFSADPTSAAQHLTAAAALFSPAKGSETNTVPPMVGASADVWHPVAGRRSTPATNHLILAAAALPDGVHCRTFACETPAVPDFGDLRGALTTRPPLMLMVSHPSFAVGQLVSRLDDALPYSAKAGAVASPVEQAQGDAAVSLAPPPMVMQDTRPPASTPTCVGIAFSWTPSSAPTASIPAAVMETHEFAEMCRILLGAARCRGWFFSPALSSSLFLPHFGPLKQGEPPGDALDAARFPEGESALAVQLFVLDDIVVLPYQREELVIYEPRYRLMLRNAIEAAGPSGVASFAIVNAKGVGTLVALAGRSAQDDGRAHCAVVGGRRLRVVPGSTAVALDAFGLSTGDVTFIDDAPCAEDDPELAASAKEAVNRFDDVLAQARAAASKANRELTHDGAAAARVKEAQARAAHDLSWALASLLPASPGTLRDWLVCTSTAQRLRSQSKLLAKEAGNIAAQWAATW